MDISGTITALITPFRNGNVDIEGLKHNIFYQLEEGVDALLVLGSTGEMLSQNVEERETVIVSAIEEVQGRVPVLVNTGAASTSEAVLQTKRAKELGASAALISSPYYVRPTEEGLYRHFCTVADEAELPIIIYNIPKRTGVELSIEVLSDLANHPNIVGIKDSTGDLAFVSSLLFETVDKDWSVIAGDDMLILPIMALGGKGVISVAANVIPSKIRKLTTAVLDGQIAIARQLHTELMPFFKALLVEPNPIPVKSAMQLVGMASGDVRLPLMPLQVEHQDALKQALQQLVKA